MISSKRYEIDSRDRQPVHPFPARMAPGIALGVVSRSRRRLRVLDPMMGSGTVVAAARAKGHCALGIDIDPLAVLISKVRITPIDKTRVWRIAQRVFRCARQDFKTLPAAHAYPSAADPETKSFLRYWFDPYARRQLAALARRIGRCRDSNTRNALWCAFSRLIITKQAGASLALDLAQSRPHKVFKTAPKEPFENFLNAVKKVVANCLSSGQRNRGPAAIIRLGDARNLEIPDGSIDLVLTSPPYLNAIDYMRCSKFSLVWMGMSIKEARQLRSRSIGTEVGNYEEDGDVPFKKLFAAMKLGSQLSSRQKAVLSRFALDMGNSLKEVSRVLSPRGKAIYVIGENTIQGTYIKNAKLITLLASCAGLKLKSRNRRTLPPNRRYLPPPRHRRRPGGTLDNRIRREVVLEFVKARKR